MARRSRNLRFQGEEEPRRERLYARTQSTVKQGEEDEGGEMGRGSYMKMIGQRKGEGESQKDSRRL